MEGSIHADEESRGSVTLSSTDTSSMSALLGNSSEQANSSEQGDSSVSANSGSGVESSEKEAVQQFFSETKKNEEADRVLIERDGKFELVDRKEIKSEYFDMIGIPTPREETPQKTTPERVKSSPPKRQQSAGAARSVYKNPEYSHIKSRYEMSEEQKQMKLEHSNAIRSRKEEEARRKREEEEDKMKNAEKCFEAWISAKSESAKKGQRLKKAAQNDTLDENNKEQAQKAYDSWLQDKKKQRKYEERLERARIADAAYNEYQINDRDMCDRAFRSWLRKKKGQLKQPSLEFGQAIQKPKPKLKTRSMQRTQSAGVSRMQSYPSSTYPHNNYYREPWKSRFNSHID